MTRSPWTIRAEDRTLPAKSLDSRRELECDRPRAYTVADLQAAFRAVAVAANDRSER